MMGIPIFYPYLPMPTSSFETQESHQLSKFVNHSFK